MLHVGTPCLGENGVSAKFEGKSNFVLEEMQENLDTFHQS